MLLLPYDSITIQLNQRVGFMDLACFWENTKATESIQNLSTLALVVFIESSIATNELHILDVNDFLAHIQRLSTFIKLIIYILRRGRLSANAPAIHHHMVFRRLGM